MGTIKDRNSMELAKAEDDIKKSWQETQNNYTKRSS